MNSVTQAIIDRCTTHHACDCTVALLSATEADLQRARAEVVRLTDGIREAADEVVEATGVDDHYLALQLRSLLDVAGDDSHEWVGIAGHPDDDECSLCGELRPDHQFQGERPVAGDDREDG